MIPKTTPTTVATSGLANDTTSFSIQASGKAFRALIDGLYSDKIAAPVRELLTNAYDSHIEADIKDRPIKVLVPTRMDPTFGVRDFGTGMSHEDVTGLYSTLFASSKESTNEQVGMLGLGSKSPFAYTDAFTVTAWDGQTSRVYMAFIEQDVPKITLVDESPSLMEKGIEVKFPVAPHDVNQFVQAVRNMVIGFSVTPEFDTDAVITAPTPIMEGDFYRVFKQSDIGWSAQCRVQQGVVTYPVDSRYHPDVPHGMLFVVEVPIGSVDVAISREALSMDDATEESVRKAFSDAWTDAVDTMSKEFNLITDPLKRAEYADGFDAAWMRHIPGMANALDLRLPNSKGSWKDPISGDMYEDRILPMTELLKRDIPGSYVMTSKKNPQSAFRYPVSGNYTFILDNMDVPRRRSRIVAAGSRNGRLLVVPAGPKQDLAVKVLKKTLGLVDSDFKPVADLLDVRKGVGGAGKARAKVSTLRTRIDAGEMWITEMRGKIDHPAFNIIRSRTLCPRTVPHNVWLAFLKDQDITDTNTEIIRMTESEVSKLKPLEVNEMTSRLKAFIIANYPNAVLEMVILRTTREYISDSANGWDEREALLAHFDDTYGQIDDLEKIENFLAQVEEIDYDGCKAVAQSVHDKWLTKYPALMADQSVDAVQYIIQQNIQEENNNS